VSVTAWKFPGTTIGNRILAGSTLNWANPNDAQADDGATADAGPLASTEYSAGLTATNFSFDNDIPAGARIDGIEIRVGDYILDTSPASFRNLHLIHPLNSTGIQNRNTDLPDFTTSLQTNDVGGATDLWGETTISWDDVHLLNFGFFIGVESAAAGTDFEVDFLQMRVHWTEAISTGWKFPGSAAGARTVGGSDVNWSNANNVKLDDGNKATANPASGESTSGLAANNFDFSVIPAGATISGVEVRVGDHEFPAATPVWDNCRLIDSDNSDAADNKAGDLSISGGTEQTDDVGGWNVHWGQGFTRADVQDADFGFFVSMTAGGPGGLQQVDFMQMRVFYHTTQTPLPILLQSDAGNGGNKGPFLIGDWIYAIVRINSGLHMQMRRAPATDPGFGFVILDAANEPTGVPTSVWSAIPFGNTIHILNANVGDIFEMEFDTATQTWTDSGTLVVDAGGDTAHRSQVDLQVRDDGDLVGTYNGETERIHGGDKERTYIMYKDGSPPTWTVGIDPDSHGDIHYGDIILTKSPNSDNMHCFWQRQTDTADPPTSWATSAARTFRSNNLLAALEVGTVDTNEAMLGAVQGVSWDNQEDSPDDQMTIWIGAQLNASDSNVVRFLGSQDDTDRITGIGSSQSGFNDPFVGANLRGVIAIDTWPDPSSSPSITEDIYVLWSGGGTQGGDEDLYFAFSDDNGVTWSSPEELINNFVISEITGSIYQRPNGDVVFGYVYDQNNTQKYGEKILIAGAVAFDAAISMRFALRPQTDHDKDADGTASSSFATRALTASSTVRSAAVQASLALRTTAAGQRTVNSAIRAAFAMRTLADGESVIQFDASIRASMALRGTTAAQKTGAGIASSSFAVRSSTSGQKVTTSALVARFAIRSALDSDTLHAFEAQGRMALRAIAAGGRAVNASIRSSMALRGTSAAAKTTTASATGRMALRPTSGGDKAVAASITARLALRTLTGSSKTITSIARASMAIRTRLDAVGGQVFQAAIRASMSIRSLAAGQKVVGGVAASSMALRGSGVSQKVVSAVSTARLAVRSASAAAKASDSGIRAALAMRSLVASQAVLAFEASIKASMAMRSSTALQKTIGADLRAPFPSRPTTATATVRTGTTRTSLAIRPTSIGEQEVPTANRYARRQIGVFYG
jgi:hypothetical protein